MFRQLVKHIWTLSVLLLIQVPPWWLSHRRVHKWLPGCLLSSLWGLRAWRANRALCSLHGELRWLQHMRPHRQGLQALGVQQAAFPQRAAKVFREVPALHSLFFGLRVSTRQRILLHLWVPAILTYRALSKEINILSHCNHKLQCLINFSSLVEKLKEEH